jgi:hypothetical protein
MIDYLKTILPRIQQYSKQLDDEANFVEIPWAFLDEDGHKVTYIFRRNNELLVSKKGEVVTGRWEYLPVVQSLLIEYEGRKRMYNQGFLDKAVMVLRKDSTEELFPLANEIQIADLNIADYLRNKNFRRKSQEIDRGSGDKIVKLKERDVYLLLISTREDDPRYIDRKVVYNGTREPFPDGTVKLENGFKIKVKNGKIIKANFW